MNWQFIPQFLCSSCPRARPWQQLVFEIKGKVLIYEKSNTSLHALVYTYLYMAFEPRYFTVQSMLSRVTEKYVTVKSVGTVTSLTLIYGRNKAAELCVVFLWRHTRDFYCKHLSSNIHLTCIHLSSDVFRSSVNVHVPPSTLVVHTFN